MEQPPDFSHRDLGIQKALRHAKPDKLPEPHLLAILAKQVEPLELPDLFGSKIEKPNHLSLAQHPLCPGSGVRGWGPAVGNHARSHFSADPGPLSPSPGRSMAEMADPRVNQRHTVLVRGLDDFSIAEGAAGRDRRGGAGLGADIETVAEREKGVRGHDAPLGIQTDLAR